MTRDKSILIKNIYYMLSYVFQTLNQSNYEEIAAEKFEDMQNLFAAILAKGIGFQLKQGLYREYRNCQEDLSVMRGKSICREPSGTKCPEGSCWPASLTSFPKTIC